MATLFPKFPVYCSRLVADGLKNTDITLPTKFHVVKAMVFPVVMYECELDHKEG